MLLAFLRRFLLPGVQLLEILSYSVSTNFCLELIEAAAKKVFIFWTLVEREKRGASERRRKEHGVNLVTLETASGPPNAL